MGHWIDWSTDGRDRDFVDDRNRVSEQTGWTEKCGRKFHLAGIHERLFPGGSNDAAVQVSPMVVYLHILLARVLAHHWDHALLLHRAFLRVHDIEGIAACTRRPFNKPQSSKKRKGENFAQN